MLERCLMIGLLALFGAPPKAAAGPELHATMDCRSDPTAGRLVCTVELEPPPGHSLSWSDALVVSAPPRARPLRSRVAGVGRPPRRIELGFVTGAGDGGRIDVLARAVTCPVERAGDCVSSSKRLTYEVR
jgi:hypothetical protein